MLKGVSLMGDAVVYEVVDRREKCCMHETEEYLNSALYSPVIVLL